MADIKEIKKYITALVNLYGIVPKPKVVEIYNLHHDEKIKKQDLDRRIKTPFNLRNNEIILRKGYFIHEAILGEKDFELLLKLQGDKPYYIPTKEEVKAFYHESYHQKSKSFKELQKFIQKNLLPNNKLMADELASEIQMFVELNERMQVIVDAVDRYGAVFDSEQQVNEFMEIMTELKNTTPIWENRGYSPAALSKKKKAETTDSNVLPFVKKTNISRNDPCICGSGKKYKKCCGA